MHCTQEEIEHMICFIENCIAEQMLSQRQVDLLVEKILKEKEAE